MDFIPLGFALYAFALTMADLHGPFGLCKLFREFVCGRCCKSKDGSCCRWEWIAEGVRCPICWSFWFSLLILPIYGPETSFAAWGVATVITIWRKGWNPDHKRKIEVSNKNEDRIGVIKDSNDTTFLTGVEE